MTPVHSMMPMMEHCLDWGGQGMEGRERQTWAGSQTSGGPKRAGWGIEGEAGSTGRPP